MSTQHSFALVPLLLAGPLVGLGRAQCETDTLSPSSAAPYGYFGPAIALEGDTAVISAPGYFDVPMAGAVHVFTRLGTRWVEQQELRPSDGEVEDFFGLSLALSGDTLAVGSGEARAYVFVRTGAGWVEQQKLEIAGLPSNSGFGTLLSLQDDTLVFGAFSEDSPVQNAGALYVFVRSGGVWSLQQRLQPADVAENDFNGIVLLSGDSLLLGSPLKDGLQGAVYRFTRSGTRWTQQEKLTALDGQPRDGFGARLALDGNTLLVRALLHHGQPPYEKSAVYVFTRSGSGFAQQQRIDLRAPGDLSWIAYPTAISGDTFVVAAPWEEADGPKSGAAYVFTRSGGTWTQAARLVPVDSASELRFGSAVAVSNDTLLIGSPGDDRAGADVGRVHVYALPGASVTYHNGRGINVDTLAATPATIGQTWTTSLGVAGPHTAGEVYLAIHRACRAGTLVLGGSAEFFLDGKPIAILGPMPHAGQGGVVTFTLVIPPNVALAGRPWAAQGILLGGPLGLTNAAAGVVR